MLGKLMRLFREEEAADQRSASIFERDGLLLFHPKLRSVSGVWRFAEPVFVTNRNRPDEIATHLLAVLAASSAGVPDIRGSMANLRPLFVAAGVRTYKSFADGTKLVCAQVNGTSIDLCPMRNLGHIEGWAECRDALVTVNIASPDLARAVLIAIDASAAR